MKNCSPSQNVGVPTMKTQLVIQNFPLPNFILISLLTKTLRTGRIQHKLYIMEKQNYNSLDFTY